MIPRISTLLAAAALLGPFAAQAQSERLLEAVRLQRPTMLASAEAERTACEKSGCDRRDALALLTGYLTLAEGDAVKAAAILRARPAPAGLGPYRAYYLGTALFYTRDYAGAAEQFALAEAGPELLATKARGRHAEALGANGQLDQAAALLDGPLDTPELLLLRAKARAALGDPKGEQADLHALLVGFPLHPEAPAAEARLVALAPRPFSFDERLGRAKVMLDAGQPEGALAELERLDAEKLAHDKVARGKVALARATALFAKGETAAAEKQLARASNGDRATALEAAMVQARRALRDDNARARELMEKIDHKFAKEPRSDEAGFFAAWLAFQASDLDGAVKGFERFDKVHPRSRKRDDALWYKALALIRLERYGEAKAALATLTDKFPRSSLVPQAVYWSARCDQLAGVPATSFSPRYAQVIAAFPGSFYAALASERLTELGQEPPVAFPEPPSELDAPVPEELQIALALAKAGLYRDSGELLQAEIGHVRSSAEAVTLGHALLKFGQFGSAYALANRLLWGQAFGEKSSTALAMFYPRAFRSSVEPESETHQVDPYFVWAIMRRESTFRTDVRSGADAFGLMQLLPRTAVEIAKKLSEVPPVPEDLYSPSVNIKLGSWYLGALNKRFGHPALAAAAYNAGPTAVLRWLDHNGKLPLDLFVEQIPYKETRGYVKQVIADYQSYHALYGKKAPRLELALPAPGDGVSF